jgi:DNA-directed RNA polymerase subunit RPC12/RpoP
MAEPGTYRSLRTVMLLTLHVAAVAALIRAIQPGRGDASLIIWVPITIAVATLIVWPISRMIFSRFDPDSDDPDRQCPRCRRFELRPLIRPGAGIFQAVSNYRCAACWTTVRLMGDSRIVELPREPAINANPAGIEFLDETATEAEIRFLDEPTKSTERDEFRREHRAGDRVDRSRTESTG